MTKRRSLIAVVDDEASVRTTLGRLLRLADYEVAAFGSRRGLSRLACDAASRLRRFSTCTCRGSPGFDVQCAAARRAQSTFPSCSSPRATIVALDQTVPQAGGVTLLRKPFSNDELLAAVGAALSRSCGGAS